MEENLLQGPINVLFTRILELKSTLGQIEKILVRDMELVKSKDLNNSGYIFLYGHFLVIRDLTGPDDNGWEKKYPTGLSRVIAAENYKKEIDSLIERESAFMIAQGYESYSTFLKDMIAIFLFLNKDLAKQVSAEFQDTMNLEEFKSTIRKLKSFRGTNNSEFLAFLRKHSLNYKNFELHNNSGVNSKDWYEIYSEVRHAIVHSGNFLKKDILEKWNKDKITLCKEYFPYKEKERYYELIISRAKAEKVLTMISEIAFQVFKSFSIKANLNWRILGNMN